MTTLTAHLDARSPARPIRARRRRLFIPAALIGALTVAGLTGELLVRLLVGSPMPERLPLMTVQANPWRGYAMVPGGGHFTYHHPVRVNSLGLRGPEVGPRRPGETRVLVLGDSLTYGQGVADDQTVPALLERRLAGDGDGAVRVINGGLRGYATNQEVGLLAELGPVIRPDVVVLMWYWNDLEEGNIDGTCARLTRSGPVAFDTWTRMEGEALAGWRRQQWLRHSAALMLLHDVAARVAAAREAEMTDLEAGLERLDRHLARLAELGAGMGARTVLATVPDANALIGDHFSRAPAAAARVLALRHGMAAVDLEPPLRGLYRRLGRLPVLAFDGHYDARANACMAEALADALRGLPARTPAPPTAAAD